VPTERPRLSATVYAVLLADLARHDAPLLRATLARWPAAAYDVPAVLLAVQSELERAPPGERARADELRACLADLHVAAGQPGKALPLLLALRRPEVFALVREHGLVHDVQDAALALVEFDHERMAARRAAGEDVDESKGEAITLLVEHTHAIPVSRLQE
jgi:hypothetical protein